MADIELRPIDSPPPGSPAWDTWKPKEPIVIKEEPQGDIQLRIIDSPPPGYTGEWKPKAPIPLPAQTFIQPEKKTVIPVGDIVLNDKHLYSTGQSSIVWDYGGQTYALDYPYTTDKLRKVNYPPEDSLNVETVENAYRLMITFGIDQSVLLGMGVNQNTYTPSKTQPVRKLVKDTRNDKAKSIYI